MKHLIAILIVTISLTGYGQKKVYYYQGTGADTLTIFENGKFESSGTAGLAKSIRYEGKTVQKNDTLLLVQETATIINNKDTVETTSLETTRVDTMLLIDRITLLDITNNNESYYKLIKEFENGAIIRELEWTYVDTLIGSRYMNDFPVEIVRGNTKN